MMLARKLNLENILFQVKQEIGIRKCFKNRTYTGRINKYFTIEEIKQYYNTTN